MLALAVLDDSIGKIMPHFLVDCSESIFELHPEEKIIEQVHLAEKSTGLFNDNDNDSDNDNDNDNDIKVRVNYFKKYSTGNKVENFIHVFSHIMEGRTEDQKLALSKDIVKQLNTLFPSVPNIGANVIELKNENYYNKNMLNRESC